MPPPPVALTDVDRAEDTGEDVPSAKVAPPTAVHGLKKDGCALKDQVSDGVRVTGRMLAPSSFGL